MKRLIILSTILSLNITLFSFAETNKPFINYGNPSSFREIWNGKDYSYKDAQHTSKAIIYSVYLRGIGRDKKDLIHLFFSDTFIKIERELNYKYDALFVRDYFDSGDAMHDRGLYIFDKESNKCLYYLLLEKIPYQRIPKGSDSTLNSIFKLKTNQNYIKNLKFPKKSIIKNYEIIHNGFIERYIIAKIGHEEALIAEMFYPQDLDKMLTPYTHDFIQKISRKMELREKDRNHQIDSKRNLKEYLEYKISEDDDFK